MAEGNQKIPQCSFRVQHVIPVTVRGMEHVTTLEMLGKHHSSCQEDTCRTSANHAKKDKQDDYKSLIQLQNSNAHTFARRHVKVSEAN